MSYESPVGVIIWSTFMLIEALTPWTGICKVATLPTKTVPSGIIISLFIKEYYQLVSEDDIPSEIIFSYELPVEDKEIFDTVKEKAFIKVATKCDLTTNKDSEAVCISLKTGENLPELKAQIKSIVMKQNLTEVEFITNQRQQKCLEETKNSLINALIAAQNGEIQDLISIDVKSALMFISEVSGEVITDDILTNIFDNFCIGK